MVPAVLQHCSVTLRKTPAKLEHVQRKRSKIKRVVQRTVIGRMAEWTVDMQPGERRMQGT